MTKNSEQKLKFSLPTIIGYLEDFRFLCKKEKGHYEMLNGKMVAEDITRYLKILKKIEKEIE